MTDTPDLSPYYLVHDVIRRGTDLLARAIADIDEGDLARARAIRWYASGVITELRSHLILEDAVYFPALAARVPTFAELSHALSCDHASLHHLTVELRDATRALTVGHDWHRHHATAVELSTTVARIVQEHLCDEEGDILPLFARHFDGGEYAALDDRAVAEPRLGQLMFTVPWIMTTADPELALAMLDRAPTKIALIWRLTRRRHVRKVALALGLEPGVEPGTEPGTAPGTEPGIEFAGVTS